MNTFTRYTVNTIAGICAVGTGMLAAATVLGTPGPLLLFLAGIFIVNYSLPFIYRGLSKWLYKHKILQNKMDQDYIDQVLKSDDDLKKIAATNRQDHTRNLQLRESFWAGFLSFLLSLSLAVGVYFLAGLLPLTTVLQPVLAGFMFLALATITFMNFKGGLKEVWEGITKAWSNNEPIHIELMGRKIPRWVIYSTSILAALSCLAGGVLLGSIVREGVKVTLHDFAGILPQGIASALSFSAQLLGPFSWIVYSSVALATLALMGYAMVALLDKEKRKAKLDLWNSFFMSSEEYCKELDTQWVALNEEINKKGNEFNENELNELYAKKDSLYHRYTVYQQPYFGFIYKSVTAVLLVLTLGGMIMQMARGYQGFNHMLQAKSIGLSHTIATGIASGVMWLSILAETYFTATILSSTMNEEALLGKQSRQYENALERQQPLSEKAEGYFRQTSRGMHFAFEGLLGLFGVPHDGHSEKTGIGFADRFKTPLSAGTALRAGLERDEGDTKLVTFDYQAYNAQPEKADEKQDRSFSLLRPRGE